MDDRPPQDLLGRRLRWITIAVLLVLAAWAALPWLERTVPGASAQPRTVTPRGDLAADEQAIIALFERARSSVVYITTSEEVLDLWTRNVFQDPARHRLGRGAGRARRGAPRSRRQADPGRPHHRSRGPTGGQRGQAPRAPG